MTDSTFGTLPAILTFMAVICLFASYYLHRLRRTKEQSALLELNLEQLTISVVTFQSIKRKQKGTRQIMKNVCFYLFIGLIIFYTVFPFSWAIVSSLKSGPELFKIEFWSTAPSWDNYTSVFRERQFGRNILNSIFVATSTVALSLSLAVAAAYALGRIQFRGRTTILILLLGVSMFPQVAVLSGMFELIWALDLYNNLLSLTLSYMIFTLPFTVWVLTAFMRELPNELEEAAIIDGAKPYTIVTKLLMPLMRPVVATTGLLAFIAAWNEFLFALTFTQSSQTFTVPVAIAMLSGVSSQEPAWGGTMAASVIVTVPLVALTLIFQKRIVFVLTGGGVKTYA